MTKKDELFQPYQRLQQPVTTKQSQRQVIADPKVHFTCQLRISEIKWLKGQAAGRGMSQNNVVSLALATLKAQIISERN